MKKVNGYFKILQRGCYIVNLGYLTAINHEVDSTESTVIDIFKIIGEGECRGATMIFIKIFRL